MDVLIVDDSRSMRMLIKRSIRQAGFDGLVVEEAGDGAEGLSKLDGHAPKLILSDWNMTGMDGERFAHSVQATHPGLTFGFITSEASEEIRERAMAAGAKFLITKPFNADDMAETLQPYL